MAKTKFAHCHPDGNTMWCQHWNGSWIGFPIAGNGGKNDETSSGEDEVSDSEVK